ncbi:MAG: hypothetical protein J0L52_02760 [Caulobacterales bacterium]|nr:hypothetical protein [Caulobacterales bacterium]
MIRRQLVLFIAASCVIAVGLMAMTVAGAPRGLVLLQGAVGLAAVIVAALGSVWLPKSTVLSARLVCIAALILMAFPFLSVGLDGVHRWFALGPIQIQPAVIALPLVAWYAVQEPDDRLAIGALLVAGVIAAFQPDQQAAQGVTAVTLCMVLLVRPAPIWWLAFGASFILGIISGFGETLEPVPYVEQVLSRALQAHWTFGLVAALGLVAVPLTMLAASPGRQPMALVMAALWLGFTSACLAGQFPSPVMGYGLSWVLGFALSLGLVARRV